MKNKIICFLLMLTMLIPLKETGAAVIATDDEQSVDLQYVNTLNVSSALTINGGIATCTARNNMQKNYPSKITMTLQKSADKSTYSKVQAWSQEYTGIGTKTLTKTKALTKGYYYRLKVVVRVYSGTEVIEKITKYSSVKYY